MSGLPGYIFVAFVSLITMSEPIDSEEVYDDLDDLLNEEEEEQEEKEQGDDESRTQNTGITCGNGGSEAQLPHGKDGGSVGNGVDPGVTEMMEELQSEFANLLKEQRQTEKSTVDTKMVARQQTGDEEAVRDFAKLLGTLKDAAAPTSSTPVAAQSETNLGSNGKVGANTDFKDVIANTISRLKESSERIESNLKEETTAAAAAAARGGNGNSDDILNELINQLSSSSNDFGDVDGMDSAILDILNQMSTKEVLYAPMKEMHQEFVSWFAEHEDDPKFQNRMDDYKKQFQLVGELVAIYEKEDYSNEQYRDQVTEILDKLEQLGDTPVAKDFNRGSSVGDVGSAPGSIKVDGTQPDFKNLDQELADTCTHQ